MSGSAFGSGFSGFAVNGCVHEVIVGRCGTFGRLFSQQG